MSRRALNEPICEQLKFHLWKFRKINSNSDLEDTFEGNETDQKGSGAKIMDQTDYRYQPTFHTLFIFYDQSVDLPNSSRSQEKKKLDKKSNQL